MTVSILSAAGRLCKKSGWCLTNLQLQKMAYLAHMFYMGTHDGEPLVSGSFEAWDLGPVHPDLYHAVKRHGNASVERKTLGLYSDVPSDHPGARFLDDAVTGLPGGRFVAITHWEKGHGQKTAARAFWESRFRTLTYWMNSESAKMPRSNNPSSENVYNETLLSESGGDPEQIRSLQESVPDLQSRYEKHADERRRDWNRVNQWALAANIGGLYT